ncbi:MAG: nucleotide exchange factor GrpE, partial [Proteobacteria bacterium]|nr:nucleotide exchange factor GrpE [Pseudomonadota bacterium]
EAAAHEGAAGDLGAFAQGVADILERYGVERYIADVGSPYVAREQRVVGSVPVDDPARDRCVAEIARYGFRTEARVLRPLEVVVTAFRPSQNQEPPSPVEAAAQ